MSLPGQVSRSIRSGSCSYWSTIFQEHYDHFAKVRVEIIQRIGLGMGSRESGNVAHVEASLGILFDNRRVFFHGADTFNSDLNQTETIAWGEPPDEAHNQERDQAG